jgi:hypothetical protein
MSQSPTSRTTSASRVEAKEQDQRASSARANQCFSARRGESTPARRARPAGLGLRRPAHPSSLSAGCSSTACSLLLASGDCPRHNKHKAKFGNQPPHHLSAICKCCELVPGANGKARCRLCLRGAAFPGFACFSPFDTTTSRCPLVGKGKAASSQLAADFHMNDSGRWARPSHTIPAGSNIWMVSLSASPTPSI